MTSAELSTVDAGPTLHPEAGTVVYVDRNREPLKRTSDLRHHFPKKDRDKE